MALTVWCLKCHKFDCICDGNFHNIPASPSEESDCKCKHCYYDHVGFRGHLEGEARLRTSCRIAQCGCPAYEFPVDYSREFKCDFGSGITVPCVFDPNCVYGEECAYLGKYSDLPQAKATKDHFHRRAKAILPPNYYYELRARMPARYGQDKFIAWVYEPWMSQGRTNNYWFSDLDPIVLEPSKGYYIIGGYRT